MDPCFRRGDGEVKAAACGDVIREISTPSFLRKQESMGFADRRWPLDLAGVTGR